MAIPIPRRKKTEVAGDFGKIRIHRHELEDEPEGALPWFTLELLDWVCIAAVTPDGRWILVRQHRQGVNDLTIETAGGIVDPGEDPAESALRELREETGWEADHAEPLGWIHPNPALQGNRCHLYLARDARPVEGWKSDASEITEPVVMTETELRKALDATEISHVLSAITLERSLSRVGSDHLFQKVFALLDQMEETQRTKVLELARRLVPGLTAEDIRNPHDFPDLADPDWHFMDGQLTGVQSVRFAMVGLRNEETAAQEGAAAERETATSTTNGERAEGEGPKR
ncbi:MAG: NUDIX hydrolase [Polyangiaceae bacterium]